MSSWTRARKSARYRKGEQPRPSGPPPRSTAGGPQDSLRKAFNFEHIAPTCAPEFVLASRDP